MAAPSSAEFSSAFQGRTVLVADDDPIIRDYLSARCNQAGLKVAVAEDGLRALLKVSKEDPDLLILDLNLPDVEGFRVCERLKDPKFRPLPVIILTASSDQKTIRRCEELGAIYIQKGPQLWDELSVAMRRIFETSKANDEKFGATELASAPKVLLVDDDAIILKGLTSRLAKYGIKAVTASNGMQGFWMALKEKPDAILTDYYMAGGDGHYLLNRIKSTPATKHIPVIVCSGSMSDAKARMPVERDLRGRGGAADFLMKPVSVETLLASLQRHAGISVDS
jgi:CheY-like chemotaxis protein